MKTHGEFLAQGTMEDCRQERRESAMNQPNKVAMAKFSVLKGVRPQLTPMRMATLKCAGQCTCRCCK